MLLAPKVLGLVGYALASQAAYCEAVMLKHNLRRTYTNLSE